MSLGVRFSVGYVSVGNNAFTTPVSYTTHIRREMGSYDELLESNTESVSTGYLLPTS